MNILIDEKGFTRISYFLHIYWDTPSYISLTLRYNRKDNF